MVRRSNALGLTVLTFFVVALLIVGSSAGSPTFAKSWRPAFSSGAMYAPAGGTRSTGCGSVIGSILPTFNLSTGYAKVDNATVTLTSCAKTASWAAYGGAAGVSGLTFSVPSTGYYNYSALWSGPLWVNLTVSSGGSPASSISAYFAVNEVLEIFSVHNGSQLAVSTQLVGTGTIHNGTKDHRLAFGAVAPTSAWLSSGHKFQLKAFIIIALSVSGT